jgi:hypothetical protein
MKEMTLRGAETDNATRRIEVLTGFRFGGRSYAVGEFATFVGRQARQLVANNRARFAPAPEVVAESIPEVTAVQVTDEGEIVKEPEVVAAPRVEIRQVGGSRWYEVVVGGVVVGKRNGEKRARVLAREHGG